MCFIFSTYPPFKLNAFDTTGPCITANSIKVVLPKALTVNYERTRDDGLWLIFTSKLFCNSKLATVNLLVTKVIP